MFLKCFEVSLVVCFRRFPLDSVIFEVFHPVWALYNIKEQAGHLSEQPSQASRAGLVFVVSWHPALYRVPVCQTVAFCQRLETAPDAPPKRFRGCMRCL